jgi:hypothetical protein
MTEIALRPECPAGHGFMTLRPAAVQTYEQKWCGTWYDCDSAMPKCRNAALLPSPELDASLARQALGQPS